MGRKSCRFCRCVLCSVECISLAGQRPSEQHAVEAPIHGRLLVDLTTTTFTYIVVALVPRNKTKKFVVSSKSGRGIVRRLGGNCKTTKDDLREIASSLSSFLIYYCIESVRCEKTVYGLFV